MQEPPKERRRERREGDGVGERVGCIHGIPPTRRGRETSNASMTFHPLFGLFLGKEKGERKKERVGKSVSINVTFDSRNENVGCSMTSNMHTIRCLRCNKYKLERGCTAQISRGCTDRKSGRLMPRYDRYKLIAPISSHPSPPFRCAGRKKNHLSPHFS